MELCEQVVELCGGCWAAGAQRALRPLRGHARQQDLHVRRGYALRPRVKGKFFCKTKLFYHLLMFENCSLIAI